MIKLSFDRVENRQIASKKNLAMIDIVHKFKKIKKYKRIM